ncbi:hypothetical protein M427DRAFT_145662 [Gonapodya prolifera JEL478]|uniref:Uncharacterized protein n=1 Tax=Gonapodya prolifera (strain JEL478) TaxID=1344416 RepID=A0A139AEQ9_GONPJ|nr:hypothetical protein M427DRAFT_145662 [Gonapodya prolifera JEL478]|eukprot:KXS15074.1 hypothetical protein M427DRAFT_145662 [Gonapodya prolifera JEL478]
MASAPNYVSAAVVAAARISVPAKLAPVILRSASALPISTHRLPNRLYGTVSPRKFPDPSNLSARKSHKDIGEPGPIHSASEVARASLVLSDQHSRLDSVAAGEYINFEADPHEALELGGFDDLHHDFHDHASLSEMASSAHKSSYLLWSEVLLKDENRQVINFTSYPSTPPFNYDFKVN